MDFVETPVIDTRKKKTVIPTALADKAAEMPVEVLQTEPVPYLVDWVCNYVDLLATEQYYEDLKYQSEDSRKETGKRENKQMPRLNNCWLKDVSSECLGKTIVRFSTKKTTEGFSQGDPVAVRQDDSMGGGAMRGIIYSLMGNLVEVFLNKVCNYLDSDSSYTIVKLADNTTHFRMRMAVQHLVQLKEHPLVSLMFGSGQLTQEPLEPTDINFFNGHLTDDQKEAVAFALSMNELAIIHGPPGTGKTTVLVEVLLHLVKMGNKVLVCAPTNVAVDNILSALVSHGHLRVVRLGHPARTGLHDFLLDTMLSSCKELPELRKELKQMELKFGRARHADNDLLQEIRRHRSYLVEREQHVTRDVLRACDIVACTLMSASDTSVLKYLEEEHFDVVIIDENSQAMEAASWVALPRAKKAILAGDHMQLSPTVHSPSPCELEVSLMERAITRLQDRVYRMLTVQHRMNTDIMRWVSDRMYEGKVSAHPSVADHLLCHLNGVEETEDTETALLLVDTAGCRLTEEGVMLSQQNIGEARIVQEVVEHLLDAGVPEEDIGVITPYSQQVQLIKELLEGRPGLEVRSVDGYQGREKEAIVLSMVRSNLDGDLGFTTDQRRLNVAVSRARRLLCVVADTRTLSTCELYQSLFTHMRQHGVVHSAHQYDCVIPPCGKTAGDKKSKGKKSSQPVMNEAARQNVELEKCMDVLQEFVKDQSRSICRFPCELTSYVRMKLHMECEKLSVKHYSEGVGDQRHLVVEKVSSCTAVPLSEGSSDCGTIVCDKVDGSDSPAISRTTNEEHFIPKTDDVRTFSDKISHEEYTVPSGCNGPCEISASPTLSPRNEAVGSMTPQFEILDDKKCESEMECSNSVTRSEINRDQSSSKKMHRSSKKKGTAPRQVSAERGTEDADDAVLLKFQLDNKTCAQDGCKKATELFGQLCQHCHRTYCLGHCMPEVHGCAAAAHTHARSVFQHPPPKPMDPVKRSCAERKLKAKLGDMSQKRKSKKK